MLKAIGVIVIALGMAGLAFAPTSIPEVDPGSLVSPLALISGAILVLKGRRRT